MRKILIVQNPRGVGMNLENVVKTLVAGMANKQTTCVIYKHRTTASMFLRVIKDYDLGSFYTVSENRIEGKNGTVIEFLLRETSQGRPVT